MNISNSVLMKLVVICDDPECTEILIRKFLNISDIQKIESRLKGCYAEIKKASENDRVIHLRNRLIIETDLERENRRSEQIDKDLDPVLEALPKEARKKYEDLLKDFKEGKY